MTTTHRVSTKAFDALIKWSQRFFDDLPWRKRRTLYRTLVSEIMLQQTTVGAVLSRFDPFMAEYPNLESLAHASEEQLTISWKGLGYYRRARNLKAAAEYIIVEKKGRIPRQRDELLKVPGVGVYTANALLSIGCKKKALALDANLERVLSRFYGLKQGWGKELKDFLYQDFEAGTLGKDFSPHCPRGINEAFMDLGRTLCQARRTSCDQCPLKSLCIARKEGDPLAYPKKINATQKKVYSLSLMRLLWIREGKILLYQKKEDEWLQGQWELPTFVISSEDTTFSQYPELKSFNILKSEHSIKAFKNSITKYRIENYLLPVKNFPALGAKLLKEQGTFQRRWEFQDLYKQRPNWATTVGKALKAWERLEKKTNEEE